MRRFFGFTPRIPPALKDANARMAAGDYQAAGLGYEALLINSHGFSVSQQAFLYLQAGRARLLSGQFSLAVTHLRRGLELLAEHQHYSQLYQSGLRIKAELEQRGLARESRLISALVHSNMPAASEIPTQFVDEIQVRLPTLCPACGVGLAAAEMNWTDANTVSCPLCNSPVDVL